MDMTPRDDMVMWGSDLLISSDASNMMLDNRSDFFTDSPNSLDEVRSRMPLDMVDDFMMLNESDSFCGSASPPPPLMNSMATQTAPPQSASRKIKPVKHPGLKLKTPIAFQKDSDPSIIPIEKDGMAICEKCGAIGVKHAFYTKERRFCSLLCAREYADAERRGETLPRPYPVFNLSDSAAPAPAADDPPSPSLALPPPRPQLQYTYEWRHQLPEPGFVAAPVSCFRHAPMADSWDNVTVGMKVEVENTDCDDFSESFPDSFWVATVLRIAGYHALLRYEGFGQNASKDFWVHLCSTAVHPVGWCATRGKPLIPPKTIEDKYRDWKEFLVKRLTGARTLPFNFSTRVTESLASRFSCGMNLEVVDKNRISRVKVATVANIVGKRLHVMYFDASADDAGFWCHEDSPLIHPVGWAYRVGQAISAPKGYMERCESGQLREGDAGPEIFSEPPPPPPGAPRFLQGMKLEAVDPLNLSSICVATVMKVLREGYIMVRIDSYDEDISGADWFCYHRSSPCVFPVGFCSQHAIPLTPPKGYSAGAFRWEEYLAATGAPPAPPQLFQREVPAHGFVVGARLEAADIMDPRLVCVGTVSRVVGRLLKVHFDGWEEEYDQWLDCESPDVYPVGWCQLVGHKLEGPRGAPRTGARTTGSAAGGTSVGRGTTSGRGGAGRGTGRKRAARRARQRRSAGRATGMVSSRTQGSSGTNIGRSSGPRAAAAAAMAAVQAELSDDEEIEDALMEEPSPPRASEATDIGGGGDSIVDPSVSVASTLLSNAVIGPIPVPASAPTAAPTSAPISAPTPAAAAPPPRTPRAANSYVQQTAATSTKFIPRLVDGGGGSNGEGTGELTPAEWNVFDVAQFLRVNDCAAYCDSFSRHRVDGAAMLQLTKDQVIDLTGGKVGPSLKIHDLIQQLKVKVNPAQERMKASLKKLL